MAWCLEMAELTESLFDINVIAINDVVGRIVEIKRTRTIPGGIIGSKSLEQKLGKVHAVFLGGDLVVGIAVRSPLATYTQENSHATLLAVRNILLDGLAAAQ